MGADSTFDSLWKELLLYSPNLPAPIAQKMVNTAYSRCLQAYSWSFLRGVGAFNIPDPYTTGSVTLTNGSATVTGSGTAWTTADHAEKQLVVNGIAPFWDILTIDSPTSLTLTTTWTGVSGTYTVYSISSILMCMPSDCIRVTSFLDMTANWWPLSMEFSQEALDLFDPRRTFAGQAVHLVSASPSPSTFTLTGANRVRYELWPRPNGQRIYFFRYIKKPSLLSAASDAPIYPIQGNTLREGAFAQLAVWPGTDTLKNPYRDDNTSMAHERLFQEGMKLCRLEDQNLNPTDIQYEREYRRLFPVGDWWQQNDLNLNY